MKDAYAILGVGRDATVEDIKRAYRRLARERHPDLDRDNPSAEDEFKELTAAYEVLSDKEKRRRHDDGEIDALGNKVGRARPRAKGQAAGYDARGAARGFRAARNPFDTFRRRKRAETGIKVDGANVNYSLEVDFTDAAKGLTKHVSMTNGKRLKVKIPAGTRDGQVLRLKGQGMPGMGGGKDGDALVEICVSTDPRFRTEGNDVHLDLPISLPEAVLGAKIAVPTLGGEVSLTIPEGANTGTALRLKGKGLKPEDDDGTPGDQYVNLRVVLPKKPDARLRAFIRDWAEGNAYDVRAGTGNPDKDKART